MKKRFFLFCIFIIIILASCLETPAVDGGDDTANISGTKDNTFNSNGSGANATEINSIAVQDDGKILIGGNFSSYNGYNCPDNIYRLTSDGTNDTTFNNGGIGTDGDVSDIIAQSDGKIIICGSFSNYNGSNVPDNIIRLNTDGSVDNTFNNGGAGAYGSITSIAIQADGKIIAGGYFTTYNGVNVSDYLMRLNSDGSYDSTFNTGGSGPDKYLWKVALDNSGRILIGGSFSNYNGTSVPLFILRLTSSGLVDNTFNNGGSGTYKTISDIKALSNGKILIAGGVTSYNGVDVTDKIFRLNSDGTPDDTFNSGGSGADNTVKSIAVQNDGKIIIGGLFTTYNGSNVPDHIMRLNSNGSWDKTFNQEGTGTNFSVEKAVIQSDGKIIIGGGFSTFNGQNAPDRIMRLNK